MPRRSRTAAPLAAVIAVVGGVVPVSASAAGTVRVGVVKHAAMARNAPPVSPGLRLHVTVALKARSTVSLAAYARAVSTPGDPNYRHFLTPKQFRRRFGASAAQVARVRRSLRARGLYPGPTSTGGLSMPVVATAAQLERAFSLSLRRIAGGRRRAAVAATAAPALDAGAAAGVQSIVGLDTTAARRPLLARGSRTAGPPAHARPRVATGGPRPCPVAQAAAPIGNAYTSDQIASAYGFTGLYAAGDAGAGTTIALYELEPNDPADIAAFQACYGTHASVSYVTVDGGAGRGAGAGEATLDIENTIGLAPAAKVIVYQGPNSNSGAPGSGPYDISSRIINQDRAQVVSVSWGECEAALGASDANAENTLFEQATVQGQSVVSAAGDSGAQDCDLPGAVPRTHTAVDDPASQPYVTGVGGTSLTALGPPPAETVWNNPGTATGGALSAGAGGGGVSSLWPMPSAQQHAAAVLGVVKPNAGGRACGRSSGSCHEVPDVSADADPNTGYQIYWNGSGTVVGQPAGWQGIGGTSGAAPVWAALLALANSAPGCADSPLGFASPALYRAAGTAYAADFHDVLAGNNDFSHTNGGQFSAGPGYDLASGLGSPNATALVGSLCADSLRLPTVSTQISAQHAAVSVRVRGSNISGKAIHYSARGLPPGLKLNADTGVISGRPSRRGDFTVQVDGHDAQPSSATTSFHWTVGAPLRISRASLATRGRDTPQLTVTVVAPDGGPLIRTLKLSVPAGLQLRSTSSVSLITNPGPLSYSDSSRGGSLTISLDKPAKLCQVIMSAPSLGGAPRRGPRTSRRRGATVTVSVGDDNRGSSRLTAKLQGA
jgi:subtilase family serine protease